MKENQTTIGKTLNPKPNNRENTFPKVPYSPTTIPPNSWFNQRKMAYLVDMMKVNKKFRVKGLMLKAWLPNNSIRNSFSLLIVKNLCIHKFNLLLFFKWYSNQSKRITLIIIIIIEKHLWLFLILMIRCLIDNKSVGEKQKLNYCCCFCVWFFFNTKTEFCKIVKSSNIRKAHLGLMSQILVRKLRKQSAGWKLYQKALDRIAVSNFV
jgi:hypothetical protein